MDRGVVLIVDDDSSLATLVEMTLKHRGYSTERADTVESAYARIQNAPIRAVVTDLDLKQPLNGYDLCQRIADGNHPIPVVMMTGTPDYLRAEHKPAGFTAEPALILEKPFADIYDAANALDKILN